MLLPAILLLAACSKETIQQPPIDETEWLEKPRGVVVYSDFNCDYFVMENYRGYAVLRMWGGVAPARGSVVYGDHDRWGISTMYNRSGRYLFRADVLDYGLSYWQAMDMIDWNCRDPWQ